MEPMFWGRLCLDPRHRLACHDGAVLSHARGPRSRRPLGPSLQRAACGNFGVAADAPADQQESISDSLLLLLKFTFVTSRNTLVLSACSPKARDLQLMHSFLMMQVACGRGKGKWKEENHYKAFVYNL